MWDNPHVNFGGGGGTSPALVVIGVVIFIICSLFRSNEPISLPYYNIDD